MRRGTSPGNGKTLIKGGWGRFDHQRQQVPELDAADAQVRTQVIYRWRDLNGNGRYDPGRSTSIRTGRTSSRRRAGRTPCRARTNGSPRATSWSLTFERELMQNFAAAGQRRLLQVPRHVSPAEPAPSVRGLQHCRDRPDPGPDGVRRQRGRSRHSFTYCEYPTDARGPCVRALRAGQRSEGGSDLQEHRHRRSSSACRTTGSCWRRTRATRRHVPILVSRHGQRVQRQRRERRRSTPNGEINTLDNGWESSTKLSGVYRFPLHDHGLGSTRAPERLSLGASGPLHRRPDDPEHHCQRRAHRYARQLPDSSQLDLRVEKTFNLAKGAEGSRCAPTSSTRSNANTTSR